MNEGMPRLQIAQAYPRFLSPSQTGGVGLAFPVWMMGMLQ